jgi:Amt family ammonium transporter
VVQKPVRRRFTAEYKRRILAEADACSEPGALGELLRREGLYSSHLTTWRRQRDDGALAGLVGITAGCANVTPNSAIIIGAVAGIVVVFSVMFFDKIKVDDPVGAISVHGVCGAWGTLAAGLFNIGGTSAAIIGVQLLGIAACFIWTFPTALVMFKLIDKAIGLRVAPEEELEGLDLAEHGGIAYPDFGVSTHGGISTVSGPPSSGLPSYASSANPVTQS